MRRRTPATRARSESGASAVEFALVSSVLFLLLFGIIQYGLYFNDSLNTRQGVREAARHAVVESFSFDSGCTTGNNAAKLLCSAREEIGAVSGETKVKVVATTWAKGSPVTICAMVHSDVIGLLPMPNDGWITSKTRMSIEQVTQAATWPAAGAQDAPGSGQSWSWCT